MTVTSDHSPCRGLGDKCRGSGGETPARTEPETTGCRPGPRSRSVESHQPATSASVTFSIPALINFECFESKPNFLINIETRSEVKINFPDYSLQRSFFFSGFDGSFEVGRPTQRVFYGSLKIALLIGDGQKKSVNNHYVRFCTVYVFSIIKLLVLAWSSSSLSDITFPAHGCSQWTRRQLISKGSPLLTLLLFSERRVRVYRLH